MRRSIALTAAILRLTKAQSDGIQSPVTAASFKGLDELKASITDASDGVEASNGIQSPVTAASFKGLDELMKAEAAAGEETNGIQSPVTAASFKGLDELRGKAKETNGVQSPVTAASFKGLDGLITTIIPATGESALGTTKAPKTDSVDEKVYLSKGATTFMFVSTALVQFMTPGLALFYAGLTGAKSTIAVMSQSVLALGIIFLLWYVFVFSMTFGEPVVQVGNWKLIGNPFTYFMWQNVGLYGPLQRASEVVVCCFPGMLFAIYQGMFAVITPALISGGIVDRLRLGPYLCFITLWSIFVYAPLGYWNWGGGWMFQLGAWDFAGGMVVHESAGFSSLGCLLFLGDRAIPEGKEAPKPHNLPLVLIGTAMLWFGWFGFNGGSALTIGGLATIAFVNSQVAPSSAMITWIALDWLVEGRPTLVGACSGVVCGLVVITPCAGFVQPAMAVLAGVLGAILCFFMVWLINKYKPFDDTCDTIGVHGAGGFLGTIFVGCLSDPIECADLKTAPDWCADPGTVTRSWNQTWIQTVCALASVAWSVAMSYLILKVIFLFTPKLVTREQQRSAQDLEGHGEHAYVYPSRVSRCSEDPSTTTQSRSPRESYMLSRQSDDEDFEGDSWAAGAEVTVKRGHGSMRDFAVASGR